ncbi:hypothetical protein [Helicobacter sp. T3_23-1056]
MKNQSVIAKNHTKQEKRIIASERSERGTSPQLRSSDSARQREWVQLHKQNPLPQNAKREFDKSNKIDCHDSTLRAESRNDNKNDNKNVDCHADFVKSARNDK